MKAQVILYNILTVLICRNVCDMRIVSGQPNVYAVYYVSFSAHPDILVHPCEQYIIKYRNIVWSIKISTVCRTYKCSGAFQISVAPPYVLNLCV